MSHVTALGQVAIPVSDVARSLAWYRDVLGLAFLFEAPPGLAFLRGGEVRVMLARPEDGRAPTVGGTVLYWRVADLEAAHAHAVAQGARSAHAPHRVAVMPDHELWMAFLHDPDGHLVGLMAEHPLPVSAPG